MQVSKSSHQILELVVRSILAVGVHMKNIHLGKAKVKKYLHSVFDPDPIGSETFFSDPESDPEKSFRIRTAGSK